MTPAAAPLEWFFGPSDFTSWSRPRWPDACAQTVVRREQWRAALAAIPEYPAGRFAGRGIVICAGGTSLAAALATVSLLRGLGCLLPVELWHQRGEVLPLHAPILAELNVTSKVFEDFVKAEQLVSQDPRNGRLYQLKPLALLHSSFEEVLQLDADNTPIRNVEYLFDQGAYNDAGIVLWPDYWKTNPHNPIWRIIGATPWTSREQVRTFRSMIVLCHMMLFICADR